MKHKEQEQNDRIHIVVCGFGSCAHAVGFKMLLREYTVCILYVISVGRFRLEYHSTVLQYGVLGTRSTFSVLCYLYARYCSMHTVQVQGLRALAALHAYSSAVQPVCADGQTLRHDNSSSAPPKMLSIPLFPAFAIIYPQARNRLPSSPLSLCSRHGGQTEEEKGHTARKQK